MPVAVASHVEAHTNCDSRQPIGIAKMMADRMAARWSMREAKHLWSYGAIAVAGAAFGAVSLALSRRRPNVREQLRHPGTDPPPDDLKESVGGPERNGARLRDDFAAGCTDSRSEAMLTSALGLPLTPAEELLPEPIGARPSGKQGHHGRPEPGSVRSGTGTSQVFESSNVPSPAAARNRMQNWIQAGCTGLILILVVFFGITLTRSLSALIAVQRDSQTAALASQQLFRTEERAWVGMVDAVPLPLRNDGGGFTVRIQNTGRTPAFNMQFSAAITLAGSEPLTESEGPAAVTQLGTLLPGAAYATDVLFRTSPEAMGALVKHQQRAVGWLRMTYFDEFKNPHFTRSCFYWYPDLKSTKPCEAFNETN